MRRARTDTSPEQAEQIEAALRQKNVESANMGFDGTWVIHPQQGETANACYTPDDETVAKVKQAVEVYHQLGGGSIVNPNTGEFEDEATVKGKLMDLAKAAQAGKIDLGYLAEQAAKSKAVTGYDILEKMGR